MRTQARRLLAVLVVVVVSAELTSAEDDKQPTLLDLQLQALEQLDPEELDREPLDREPLDREPLDRKHDHGEITAIISALETVLEQVLRRPSMQAEGEAIIVDEEYFADRETLLKAIYGLARAHNLLGRGGVVVGTIGPLLMDSFNVNKLVLAEYPTRVLRAYSEWLTARVALANSERDASRKAALMIAAARECYELPLARYGDAWDSALGREGRYYLHLVAHAYRVAGEHSESLAVYEMLCTFLPEDRVYRGALFAALGELVFEAELYERYLTDPFFARQELFQVYPSTLRNLYVRWFYVYYEQEDHQKAIEQGYELPLELFGGLWQSRIWNVDVSYFQAVVDAYTLLGQEEKAAAIQERLTQQTNQ